MTCDSQVTRSKAEHFAGVVILRVDTGAHTSRGNLSSRLNQGIAFVPHRFLLAASLIARQDHWI